jgi:hypothetical protein
LRDPENRFAILLDLAMIFSGTSREAWGYSAERVDAVQETLGIRLPESLARWYTTVGAVSALTSSQNRLRPPERLQVRDGVLLLYDENQGCTVWGIPVDALAQQDPPVVLDRSDELQPSRPIWRRESDSLSSFSLSVALTEICVSGAGFGGHAEVDAIGLASLRRSLRQVPVQPLRWPQGDLDTGFLVGDDLIVFFQDGLADSPSLGPITFLYVGAAEDNAADYLLERVQPGHLDWGA